MAVITDGTEIKFVETNGTVISFTAEGTAISFASGSGSSSGSGSGSTEPTGKMCICGEYGYHYCPCYGEYVDPDKEEDNGSAGGTGSGGGSTDTSSFTCDSCGQTWTEADLGSYYEYGVCPCCG